MRKLLSATLLAMALGVQAQTLNVNQGNVTYAIPAAEAQEMPFGNATTLTIGERTYTLTDITSITIDDSEVKKNTVKVTYNGENAQVLIAGNIAPWISATVKGAHVAIMQDYDYAGDEITYELSGASDNGSLWMDGKQKASFLFNGLTLHNPDSAAVNILDGKRISIELAEGTVNALSDGEGGDWKACLMVKGHTELKNSGTLTIVGNTGHAFWSNEYIEVKKTFGTLNITKAVGDGINVNQYFEMKGGAITIGGVGDDGIQLSYDTDDDGNIEDNDENTGLLSVTGGTLTLNLSNAGGKALKTDGRFLMSGGKVDITQSGNLVATDDLSYSTSIKTGGDIDITGGELTINNTAQGGKGLNADGNITIDESSATVILDIKANGEGGTAETSGETPSGETQKSYKVYVTLPTTGGGGGPGGGGGSRAWSKVYLYKADGTLVQQLTQTVTRTVTSGYTTQTYTFYYYDFKDAEDGYYYYKSDDYTSQSGWSGSTTYTILSNQFEKPTSGEDVYYQITNSYQTSGTTRTYSLTNVTQTFNGSTSDQSDENGTSYNAAGIKADGNITITAGTITVENSGDMSKSIKSKGTVTINGGTLTLKASGGMRVINNDASYSTCIKTVNYIQNGGDVDLTFTGTAGKGISATDITVNDGKLTANSSSTFRSAGTNDAYTAKGMKADGNMALNGGDITIKMTGQGGKGIKVNGTYTQGTSDGEGPTLNITTTGSAAGTSSGGWGGGGKQDYYGCAKAIKVMGQVTIYGGQTEIYTSQGGSEGLESKTGITINGGKHYLKCYDDCMNSSGKIVFDGGVTVCYSNGNDAVDSNYNSAGAITIGNGVVFAYTTIGGAEEGLDCDNNSNIRITGTGIAISAGASQGGGGGWGGSGNTITGAAQGYAFVTSSISYQTGKYYTLANASGNNLVTYSFEANCSSSLALFTATGMTKNSSYNVKVSSKPTDAETEWHGLYLGSSAQGTGNALTTFTAN